MVVPHPLFQPFLERYSVTVVLKGPPPGSSKKFSPLLLVLQKSRKTPNDWQFIHVYLFTVGFTHLFRGFLENFWSNSSTFTLSHRWWSRACYFPISEPQTSNRYPRPPTNTPDLQPIPQTSNQQFKKEFLSFGCFRDALGYAGIC